MRFTMMGLMGMALAGVVTAATTASAGEVQTFSVAVQPGGSGNVAGYAHGTLTFDSGKTFRASGKITDNECDGRGVKLKFLIRFADGSNGDTAWAGNDTGCDTSKNFAMDISRNKRIAWVQPKICTDYAGDSKDCDTSFIYTNTS